MSTDDTSRPDEPIAEGADEPTEKPTQAPVEGPTAPTEAELNSEVEANLTSEPDAELVAESDAELAAESDAELAAESDVELAAESDAGLSAESDAELAAEPDVELAAEPDAELAAKSEVELAAEPEAGLAAEPEAGLAAEPEAGLAVESDAELAAEPDVGLAAEPEAGLAAEPEAELAGQDANDLDQTQVIEPADEGVGEQRDEEVLADTEIGKETRATRPWYRRWPFITAMVVLVLACVYVGAAFLVGSRVPAGTKVWGVSIGSMDASQARETLERELGPLLETAHTVTVGESEAQVVPAEAGLGVDYDKTVGDLTEFSLDPRHVYRALFGSRDIEPAQTVDQDAMSAAMSKLASAVNVDPVDANVVFEEGKPVVTEPVSGVELNEAEAATTFQAQYADGAEPIALPYDKAEPEIGEEALQAVKDTILTPLAAGPVVVVLGDDRAELTPEELGSAATLDMKTPAITFDPKKLEEIATEKLPALRSTGEDARIVMQDGKPVVIPSKTGKALDSEDFVKQVSQAATADEKEVTPAFTEADADFSTADANKLGVKEVVGEFDTPLTADQVRTTNLIVGTKAISNTLVKPGETFSLLDALGPVTYERGFVDSGVVNNGFATQALGGGLSQLSTTTMNAAFFAGMDLLEFRQHTRYFSRYPEGREATLWGPSLDMKWKNNTDYGILVDAYVANNRVYVRLWSTKVWTVEAWTSERRNITSPQLVYNNRADCKPEHGTTPGFTVDFGRKRYKNGSLVDSQSWTWTYDAWPIVRCGSPGA